MKIRISDYGMLVVLAILCSVFSVLTIAPQVPRGEAAAAQVSRALRDLGGHAPDSSVLIAVQARRADDAFLAAMQKQAAQHHWRLTVVRGEPSDARQQLSALAQKGQTLTGIGVTQSTANWLLWEQLKSDFPQLGNPPVVRPVAYAWPNFLMTDNLLNIANQIAVIAIVAIGMTMVMITGGIDLSVGSLIALSAVVCCLLIEHLLGGLQAAWWGMLLAALIAMLLCGAVGLLNGALVTGCQVPPFIATLSMMLVASGSAYLLTGGESVYRVPASFVWVGRGADFAGLPNAVVLLLILYLLAHFWMTRTVTGRYLYAVGGNIQAARLSGVPVKRVLLFAYAVSGLLAGLGGVIMSSQLKSGAPTYGQMYEMYVIAAVVVGGTSLTGGSGKMFGTLIGALIIAVIQNGMNLLNVESYTQKVVLGLVILAAVLLDRLKQRN